MYCYQDRAEELARGYPPRVQKSSGNGDAKFDKVINYSLKIETKILL